MMCTCVREKEKERPADRGGGLCLLYFSGRLWTPDRQSSCLSLRSVSDCRHARHCTNSISASRKDCRTCHVSPPLWPKHWEEQLCLTVLESSPQALVPLIQALGRGRGGEGCSPHCGQGAENTEGTEDQAEPWKPAPPPCSISSREVLPPKASTCPKVGTTSWGRSSRPESARALRIQTTPLFRLALKSSWLTTAGGVRISRAFLFFLSILLLSVCLSVSLS